MLDLELAPGDKVDVGATLNGGLTPTKIKLAIQKTRELFESLGVKTRLSQYGVGVDKNTRCY